MKFGIIGPGRIGASLARRGLERGHEVVGYNRSPEKTRAVQREYLDPAMTIEELSAKLQPPRIILMYVTNGDATEQMCLAVRPVLEADDIVVDGGNSHWEDSQRRHAFFAESGVRFLDVGTSGGVSGARRGACFMVGGGRDAYDVVEPILRDLALDTERTFFVGGPGSGHCVKLVRNAIEFDTRSPPAMSWR